MDAKFLKWRKKTRGVKVGTSQNNRFATTISHEENLVNAAKFVVKCYAAGSIVYVWYEVYHKDDQMKVYDWATLKWWSQVKDWMCRNYSVWIKIGLNNMSLLNQMQIFCQQFLIKSVKILIMLSYWMTMALHFYEWSKRRNKPN